MAAKLNSTCANCAYEGTEACQQCIDDELAISIIAISILFLGVLFVILMAWTGGEQSMHLLKPLTFTPFLMGIYGFICIFLLVFLNISCCGKWSHAPHKGLLIVFWPVFLVGLIIYSIVKGIMLLINLAISSFVPDRNLEWNGWRDWLLRISLKINGKDTLFLSELKEVPQKLQKIREKENNVNNRNIQLNIKEEELNQKERQIRKREDALQQKLNPPKNEFLSRKVEI